MRSGTAYTHADKRRDGGYVVIAVAALLIVFCAILGLTTDVGMLYFQKGRMQGAADSAAIAGARELLRGNTSLINSEAQADALSNGYAATDVTVNRPPTSGDHNGDAKYVEVLVVRAEPTFFMKALGRSTVNVQARAVAGLESAGTCIYVLDPSGHPAMEVSGGGIINLPCGIVVNSTDVHALSATGGSCINAASPATIEVAGDYTPKPGCFTPATPSTGTQAATDPLMYLTAPTAAATCDAAHTNYKLTSGTASITAGTYCHTGSNNAIDVKGGATLNLGAGTYILKGGGLNVAQNTTHFNGTGVTIYNTCDSGACTALNTTGYEPLNFNGGPNVDLHAPTSGSLGNVLFFIDRLAPADETNTMSGGATFIFEGTLYAKTEEFLFSGGTITSSLTVNIVSRLLTFTGGSSMNLGHTFTGSGSAIKEIALVE